MSTALSTAWDDTEVPAVAPADLGAALALWLERERQGIVLAGPGVATQASIDAEVIAMFPHPSRGLAVLLRMRCLIGALAARRFQHYVRGEKAAALPRVVETAASLRLNPRWGMSPVRLAWAMCAAEAEGLREAA